MIVYIVLILMSIVIFMNYYLGARLYKEPHNEGYCNNVRNINTIKLREIMTSPSYIIPISIFTGIAIGLFVAFATIMNSNAWIIFGTCIILFVLYLNEISRRISLKEDTLEFRKAFQKNKVISLDEIKGMYIYTYNRDLLEKHAFTTKLVVIYGNEKYKYTLGGIEPKAVLSMMKNNFNVDDYKIYYGE